MNAASKRARDRHDAVPRSGSDAVGVHLAREPTGELIPAPLPLASGSYKRVRDGSGPSRADGTPEPEPASSQRARLASDGPSAMLSDPTAVDLSLRADAGVIRPTHTRAGTEQVPGSPARAVAAASVLRAGQSSPHEVLPPTQPASTPAPTVAASMPSVGTAERRASVALAQAAARAHRLTVPETEEARKHWHTAQLASIHGLVASRLALKRLQADLSRRETDMTPFKLHPAARPELECYAAHEPSVRGARAAVHLLGVLEEASRVCPAGVEGGSSFERQYRASRRASHGVTEVATAMGVGRFRSAQASLNAANSKGAITARGPVLCREGAARKADAIGMMLLAQAPAQQVVARALARAQA